MITERTGRKVERLFVFPAAMAAWKRNESLYHRIGKKVNCSGKVAEGLTKEVVDWEKVSGEMCREPARKILLDKGIRGLCMRL